MRLALYTRRSTERQIASPQTQEQQCRAWAEANGHVITRVYHEVPISGKAEIERRIALPELLAAVRDRRGRDFDGIIVWRTDRLCRNPAEWHRILAILDKHGCALISIKDPVRRETATDRLISNIMADINAHEREVTGERIYAHHLAAFLRGQWPGGPIPLGLRWIRDRKIFVPDDRADDVAAVFAAFIEHAGNATATAGYLNSVGIPSPRGGLWSNVTVLGLLRNPMYRRRLSYDGREIDAPEIVPRIVDEELVAQADRLLNYGRVFTPRQIGSKRPYSGLIHCSVCGAPMILSVGSAPEGRRERWYPNWVCRRRKQFRACPGRYVSHRNVETLVGRLIQQFFTAIRADIRRPPREPRRKAARSTSAKRIAALNAQRQRLVKLFILGRVDEPAALAELDKIDRAIKSLSAEPLPDAPAELTESAIAQALSTLADDWPAVPDNEKRALLLHIGAQFTINTDPNSNGSAWMTMDCAVLDRTLRVEGTYRGSRWGIRFPGDPR